jgi:hypothetical protein
MGFEISILDFMLFFSSFAVFIAFLWGIKKAIGFLS